MFRREASRPSGESLTSERAIELLAERLRDNKLICLMSDRDLTRSGVEVDFFGEATAQASPELVSEQVNVVSAGSVTWADADAIYSNSVIVIGD